PIEAHKKIQAKEDIILLDVSSPRENEEVRIPGARLIPLGSLRVRLKELPFDKTIIVFCRISLRGYEAALILQSAGFQNVYVLDGGVEMWPYDKVCGRQ
ncbi:MAG: rhodanese-like domain-containing protein, partial [Planctomycetes bacterium]|nr:rhodanese-like domain-containing protein [Planctomycetota bacterium]